MPSSSNTRVAVIGGGITGVTTAYTLRKRGCEVTLFDRHPHAAMETSFANGGQLSASNAEVWNSWPTVMKGVKWMISPGAPWFGRREILPGARLGPGGPASLRGVRKTIGRSGSNHRQCLVDLPFLAPYANRWIFSSISRRTGGEVSFVKKTLLFGTSLLALAAMARSADAAAFGYTGAVTDYTVPVPGVYNLVAFGAQGGSQNSYGGGLGARIGGDFTLAAGDVLEIAVGGAGGDSPPPSNVTFPYTGAGGGGGTFVYDLTTGTKLVIAGGGGGADNVAGGLGQTGTSGHASYGPYVGAGGSGGQGGAVYNGGPGGGGGGGGFASAGGSGGGYGGGAFPGLAGGRAGNGSVPGGFGGGGGGSNDGGGGGGGYSGGGGGYYAAGPVNSAGFNGPGGGGGGGSFNGGTNQTAAAGYQTGNGAFDIAYVGPSTVDTPEPASAALLAAGLTGLGVARRRKTAK